MPDSKIKNLPASIRQKLLNLAQERNDDFGLVLTKYGLERMLFRLSKSKYRDKFILKGALLFELWTKERYRATRDADFLAEGDNSPERFIRIFQEISAIEAQDDGLRFDPKTVKAERIKEDADYGGVRVTLTAFLEKAQIPIQIDIGFGDAISPGPIVSEYPTLFDLPGPRLLTYPRETVVSEKLEAMVKLGIANSRMKDFHDLHSLSKTFEFDGEALVDAIRATFERRGTAWPDGGTPLAPEFYEDENKIKQWNAFCNKNKPRVQGIELKVLIARLSSFLLPVLRSAEGGLEFKSNGPPAMSGNPLRRNSSFPSAIQNRRGPLRCRQTSLSQSIARSNCVTTCRPSTHTEGSSVCQKPCGQIPPGEPVLLQSRFDL